MTSVKPTAPVKVPAPVAEITDKDGKVLPAMKDVLDILLYDDNKGIRKRKLIFELQTHVQTSEFAEAFLEAEGLNVIMQQLKASTGAVQGGLLNVLRGLLVYVNAVDQLNESPDLIETIYGLLSPQADGTPVSLSVVKPTLEILIVICGIMELGHKHVNNAAKHKVGFNVLAYSPLVPFLSSSDLLTVKNTLLFMNIIMRKKKNLSEVKAKKLLFRWKEAGILSLLKPLTALEDEDIQRQLTVLQKTADFTIPRSWEEAHRFKTQLDEAKKKYETAINTLFVFQQQQAKMRLLKSELNRAQETIRALSIIMPSSSTNYHPSKRFAEGGGLQVGDLVSSAMEPVDTSQVSQEISSVRKVIFERFLSAVDFKEEAQRVVGYRPGSGGFHDPMAPPPEDDDFLPPPEDDDFLPPPEDDDLPPPEDDDFLPPPDDDDFPPDDDDDFPPDDDDLPPGEGGAPRRGRGGGFSGGNGGGGTGDGMGGTGTGGGGVGGPGGVAGAAGGVVGGAAGIAGGVETGATAPAPGVGPKSVPGSLQEGIIDSSSAKIPVPVGGAPKIPGKVVGGPPPPPPGGKTGAPPPPPPLPGKKGAPPPPMFGKKGMGGAKAVVDSRTFFRGPAPSKKMKPLHWDKLKMEDEGPSLWHKLYKGDVDAPFNYEEFENMFSQKDVVVKEVAAKPKQVLLLDEKTHQKLAIMLHKLPSIASIQRALLELDNSVLGKEALVVVKDNCPNPMERQSFLKKVGTKPEEEYTSAEKYMAMVITTSEFEKRIGAWLFTLEWTENVEAALKPMNRLEKAMKCILNSKYLPYYMGVLLGFGNMMNFGSTKGNAPSVALSFLNKLEMTKDNRGKTSLYSYLFTTVRTKNPEALQLPEEMAPLFDGIKGLKWEDFEKSVDEAKRAVSIFDNQSKVVKKELEKQGMDTTDPFVPLTAKFIVTANAQLKTIEDNFEALKGLNKNLIEYFNLDPKTGKLEHIFEEIIPFVDKVKKSVADAMKESRRMARKGQKINNGAGLDDVVGKLQEEVIKS